MKGKPCRSPPLLPTPASLSLSLTHIHTHTHTRRDCGSWSVWTPPLSQSLYFSLSPSLCFVNLLIFIGINSRICSSTEDSPVLNSAPSPQTRPHLSCLWCLQPACSGFSCLEFSSTRDFQGSPLLKSEPLHSAIKGQLSSHTLVPVPALFYFPFFIVCSTCRLHNPRL